MKYGKLKEGFMSEAKVIKVPNENTVVINRGSDNGVKLGQTYLICGIGEELFDLETKESLGLLELARGTGTSSHIQPKMSQLVSDQYEETGTKTTKRTRPGFFAAAAGEVIEEVLNSELVCVAFDSPEIGDSVRRVL